MAKHIDLVGRRFGKLLVVEKLPERQDRYTTWRCRCDCGGEIITLGSDAHQAEQVARTVPLGEELLRRAGFRYITTFASRRPEFHPL